MFLIPLIMENRNFIHLIETYEELVNVVYDLGHIRSDSKEKKIKKSFSRRRTELLGDIEDQRQKLQINNF